MVFFLSGCSGMPKVGGIDFHLGSHEPGLWYDSDNRKYDPNGFGIKFSILYGKLVTPVDRPGKNAWQGDTPAFVLRSPVFIFPYISIAFGRYGFYLGTKPYRIYEPVHTSPERYGRWWKDEVGSEEDPAEFLTLSATIRRTRWE